MEKESSSARKQEAKALPPIGKKNNKEVHIHKNDVVCLKEKLPVHNYNETPEMLLLTHPGNQVFNLLLLQQAANFSSTSSGDDPKRVAANNVADEVYSRQGNFVSVHGIFHSNIPEVGVEMSREEAVQMILKRLDEVATPDNCRPIGDTSQRTSPDSASMSSGEADVETALPPSSNNAQNTPAPQKGASMQSMMNPHSHGSGAESNIAPAPNKSASMQPMMHHQSHGSSFPYNSGAEARQYRHPETVVTVGSSVTITPDSIIVPSEDSRRVKSILQAHPGNQAYMRTLIQYASRLARLPDQEKASVDMERVAASIVAEMHLEGRMFICIGKFRGYVRPKNGRLISRNDAIRRIKSDIKVASRMHVDDVRAAVMGGTVGAPTAKPPPPADARDPISVSLKPPPPYSLQNGPGLPPSSLYGQVVMGGAVAAVAKPPPARARDPVSVSLKPTPSYSLQNGQGPAAPIPAHNEDRTPRKSKRKISTRDIEAAIPADASSTFVLFDRRVNLDAHDKDASLYSLLRSWVQDDPYRKIPTPGLDITECDSGPNATTTMPTTSCYTNKNLTTKQVKCDIVSELNGSDGATYSTDELRANLIKTAKRVKRHKLSDFKRRDAEAVAMLKQRGILLQR